MDPASIAGLLFQVTQLAIQSGSALYQFVGDAKNINGHVRNLKHELDSLADACNFVRGQLRAVAEYYKFCEEHGEDGASMWSSIESHLKSCKTTLRTLTKAVEKFNHNGSNLAMQGIRQFKLNLKQDQIIAMKGQIQSHTSALQLCLIVMDIKISHLASRKVDRSLRKKLGDLEEKMQTMMELLRASHAETAEEQTLLECDNGIGSRPSLEEDTSPVPAPAIPDSNLEHFVPSEHLEESWIWLDHAAARPSKPDRLGDDLVLLQCAKETLSQATSLYEESLYEESVGRGGEDDTDRITDQPTGSLSELFILVDEAIDAYSSNARTPKALRGSNLRSNMHPAPRKRNLSESLGLTIITKPLNMPPQIVPAFDKMKDHFHGQQPLTATAEEQNSPTTQTPSMKLEPEIVLPLSSNASEDWKDSVKTRSKALKTNVRSHKKTDPKGWATRLGIESFESLSSNVKQYPCDNATPLQYLKHVEQELQDISHLGVSPGRRNLLSDLQPDDTVLLPSKRVALVGRLGIGKTYVAAAHAHCLRQSFKDVSIFWMSALHLAEDCQAVTELLRMKRPTSVPDSWSWLGKLIRCIPRRITVPWLVVVDGANLSASEHSGIQKLIDAELDSNGYILITTRHISTAQAFVKGGEVFQVDTLDDQDAANLLAVKSPVPKDFKFDMLAQALDYDPFVVMQVRAFLDMTSMTVSEFHVQLESILDEQSWSSSGRATLTARLLARQQRQSENVLPIGEISTLSTLLSVMRVILNPSWLMLFDALHEKYPKAAELLSTITAQRMFRFARTMFVTSSEDANSMDLLVDQSFLASKASEIVVPRLMLIGHRVWLIGHDAMDLV